MKIKNYILSAFLIVGIALTAVGCNQLKQLANAIENAKRLQFQLGAVNGFRIAGVDISNKNSLSDLSAGDMLSLGAAISRKSLPAEFILNVNIKNPNDGKGGTNASAVSLTAFEWRLLIDDVPTISGNIASPVSVPSSGNSTVMPLSVSMDFYQFFGNNGVDKVKNLILAVGGSKNNSARLKLDALPTIKVGSIPISYPNRITIINTEFRG